MESCPKHPALWSEGPMAPEELQSAGLGCGVCLGKATDPWACVGHDQTHGQIIRAHSTPLRSPPLGPTFTVSTLTQPRAKAPVSVTNSSVCECVCLYVCVCVYAHVSELMCEYVCM